MPVAPHAGVWIEIRLSDAHELKLLVAPHAGVWIEIDWPIRLLLYRYPSLPTRECGLKLGWLYRIRCLHIVAPLVGVWIEI